VNVEWSDPALRRIDETADHIAMDHPAAAEKWLIELLATVDRLSGFPMSGRVVPEIEDDEVREIIYGAYHVFYQVGDVVEVLTVRRGSQLIREDEAGVTLPRPARHSKVLRSECTRPVGRTQEENPHVLR
jgi:toxin ParE1/3/4